MNGLNDIQTSFTALRGKVLFLHHIKGSKPNSQPAEVIRRLHGELSEFFDNRVDIVITNQSDSTLQRRFENSCSEASSPASYRGTNFDTFRFSPTGMSLALHSSATQTTPVSNSPLYSQSSPYSSQSSPFASPSPAVSQFPSKSNNPSTSSLSRGQRMTLLARTSSSVDSILEKAYRRKVCVVSVKEFWKWFHSLPCEIQIYCEECLPVTVSEDKKLDNKFGVKAIRSPCIKIIASSGSSRPFYVDTTDFEPKIWPSDDFISEKCANTENSLPSPPERRNKKSVNCRNKGTISKKRWKNRLNKLIEKKKKSGKINICEACHASYNNLSKHMKSDVHKTYAAKADELFTAVDKIIESLPTIENVLRSAKDRHSLQSKRKNRSSASSIETESYAEKSVGIGGLDEVDGQVKPTSSGVKDYLKQLSDAAATEAKNSRFDPEVVNASRVTDCVRSVSESRHLVDSRPGVCPVDPSSPTSLSIPKGKVKECAESSKLNTSFGVKTKLKNMKESNVDEDHSLNEGPEASFKLEREVCQSKTDAEDSQSSAHQSLNLESALVSQSLPSKNPCLESSNEAKSSLLFTPISKNEGLPISRGLHCISQESSPVLSSQQSPLVSKEVSHPMFTHLKPFDSNNSPKTHTGMSLGIKDFTSLSTSTPKVASASGMENSVSFSSVVTARPAKNSGIISDHSVEPALDGKAMCGTSDHSLSRSIVGNQDLTPHTTHERTPVEFSPLSPTGSQLSKEVSNILQHLSDVNDGNSQSILRRGNALSFNLSSSMKPSDAYFQGTQSAKTTNIRNEVTTRSRSPQLTDVTNLMTNDKNLGAFSPMRSRLRPKENRALTPDQEPRSPLTDPNVVESSFLESPFGPRRSLRGRTFSTSSPRRRTRLFVRMGGQVSPELPNDKEGSPEMECRFKFCRHCEAFHLKSDAPRLAKQVSPKQLEESVVSSPTAYGRLQRPSIRGRFYRSPRRRLILKNDDENSDPLPASSENEASVSVEALSAKPLSLNRKRSPSHLDQSEERRDAT